MFKLQLATFHEPSENKTVRCRRLMRLASNFDGIRTLERGSFLPLSSAKDWVEMTRSAGVHFPTSHRKHSLHLILKKFFLTIFFTMVFFSFFTSSEGFIIKLDCYTNVKISY